MDPTDNNFITFLQQTNPQDLNKPGTVVKQLPGIFSVDMSNLYEEEHKYVLNNSRLVLSHAQNLQWYIDNFQLNASLFVLLYGREDDPIAQLVVNAMIAGYVQIYENIANRMSLVLFKGFPAQLVHLKEWLHSQNTMTTYREVPNSCAHEANVKAPLQGTTMDEWSIFKPQVFFEHLEASLGPLLLDLIALVASMERKPRDYRRHSESFTDGSPQGDDQQIADAPLGESPGSDFPAPDPDYDLGTSTATESWPAIWWDWEEAFGDPHLDALTPVQVLMLRLKRKLRWLTRKPDPDTITPREVFWEVVRRTTRRANPESTDQPDPATFHQDVDD